MPVARIALTATIASGGSLSGAIDLLGYDLVALEFPSAWTAADVTLQTSSDGVTYRNVYSDAAVPAEVTIGADADLHVNVTELVGRSISRYIKVRSGPAGVPVNQAADRVIKAIGRTET